jgi:YD repeat-containing protein
MTHRSSLLLALFLASATPSGAQSYTYDEAGRLIQVAYPNGRGIRYAYDDADNLVAATGIPLPAAPSGVDALRTSPTAARLNWTAPQGADAVVIMRRVAGSEDWQIIATLAGNAVTFTDGNLDPSVRYEYRIAARNGNGLSAYSAEVRPSTASSIRAVLAELGARAFSTSAASQAVQTGYSTVEIDSGSTPYGTAIFSLTANGVVISEAGVPASPPTTLARIFVEHRNITAPSQFSGALTVTTGLAVVNPGESAASLELTLRDGEGRVAASAAGSLPKGAHYSGILSDLRGLSPGFVFPASFPGGFGSLEIGSDQPISVLALRATTNQRGELLFTTTPIVDLTSPPRTEPAYLPQFADGGGFSTSIFLMNTTGRVQAGSIEVFGGDGSPLAVAPVGGQSAASFPYNIQPGGLFVLESDGARPVASAGWVRVTPGSAQTVPVAGGAFRVVQQGTVVNEAGVPGAVPTTRARVYVDSSAGRDTGIAIANPGGEGANIRLNAFSLDGRTPAGAGVQAFALSGRGHRANLAGDLMPGLPSGFVGLLEISSPAPFVALTLRALFNARGELLLTTVPIADLTRPAPSPLIFPHIADGGGFRTEFILLGPISAADGTLNLFAGDGSPLPAGRLP